MPNEMNGKDPHVTVSDDEDSEKEDDLIKPTDNLVLIGHVEGDASILEVYGTNFVRIIQTKSFDTFFTV